MFLAVNKSHEKSDLVYSSVFCLKTFENISETQCCAGWHDPLRHPKHGRSLFLSQSPQHCELSDKKLSLK